MSPGTDKHASAPDVLALDHPAEVERIAAALRRQVGETLRRRGLVVGMSGGIDSSVCAALAVRALGTGRVFGLLMPERDSDPDSQRLAAELATQLGIEFTVEDIAPILEGAGCYQRRDDAIREAVPEYGAGWRSKIVMPGNRLDSDQLNVPQIAVQSPGGGALRRVSLSAHAYLGIVAATNFKQRVRAMLEYYHADRLHYAVVGTPNLIEYDQGFFVKGGDGLADVKPIAHLYKTQVIALGRHLGVPDSITGRTPTTDTFSLPQTQEEFYFALPTLTMDLALFARNAGQSAALAAASLGLSEAQVVRAWKDIDQKRVTTRYLHAAPLFVTPPPGVSHS